jgi:hypothetical protein
MREEAKRPSGDAAIRVERPLPEPSAIHVGAVIGPEWAKWFEGAEIMDLGDGSTLIVVGVRDQAMLFGVLLRVRDLRIPLLGLYPGRDLPGVREAC